jgi:hypothetical protein
MVPLPEILARMQSLKLRIAEFTLQQRWVELMGTHIGGHSSPEMIRHRKLYLVAENSVWLHQLLFLKAELLGKISSAFGPDFIDDIVLKVGLMRAAPCQAASDMSEELLERPISETGHGLGSELIAAVEESIQGVADPVLFDRLRTLFLKSVSASA